MPPLSGYVLAPLSIPEQVALAVIRYFPADQWGNALNVARLESGWNPEAHNTAGEDSRGIFQVNIAPGANPRYADRDLFDVETNVAVASEIYRGWQNWGAWYNSAVALGLPT